MDGYGACLTTRLLIGTTRKGAILSTTSTLLTEIPLNPRIHHEAVGLGTCGTHSRVLCPLCPHTTTHTP